MLKKLLKYEFRSGFYILLPLYGSFLAVSAVCRIFSNVDFLQDILEGAPYVFSIMVYIGLFIGTTVMSMLLIVQRFYKGLLSEEGYLMFTLPVKPWQLIVSKGIVATATVISSMFVTMLSIMILSMTFRDFWNFLSGFNKAFYNWLGTNFISWPLFLLEIILVLFVCLWKHIAHAYSAMAFGQLARKNRLALSFVVYGAEWIGITLVWVIIGSIFGKIDLVLPDSMTHWFNHHYQITCHMGVWFLLLWQGAELAFYYFTTHWMLSKHLNLE